MAWDAVSPQRPGVANGVSRELDSSLLSIYIDIVDDSQQLANAAGAADPATGLRAVGALRKLVDHLEALQVRNARTHGWSWQAIADALGVTRQAVHQKHAHRTQE
jgi:hypothetical protein